MNKEEIAEVVRLAVAETLAVKEDIIGSEFDDRYHDVNLLMKRYRWLKKYFANVSPEEQSVSAICKLNLETNIMMGRVEKMLATYKAMCLEMLGDDYPRRWEVIYLRYIGDEQLTADEIADRLGVDKRTVFRDSSRAMEDMAVLLFGIEAIGSWKRKP